MNRKLLEFKEARDLIKSIKTNVTWVDWRTKRKIQGEAVLCELCGGIIAPFQVRVTLMDGTTVCNGCVFVGEDLMKII